MRHSLNRKKERSARALEKGKERFSFRDEEGGDFFGTRLSHFGTELLLSVYACLINFHHTSSTVSDEIGERASPFEPSKGEITR